MARVRTIQNSLNAGEFSPLLEGRSDLAKYKNALHTATNIVCMKHGGFYRRAGTHFVAEVKTSAKKTRLIAFQFSTVQAYIVEMGDGYFRFYKNAGRIESPPGTPVEISSPYSQTDIFDIHYAESADVLYLAHPSFPPMKLSRFSDTSWSLTTVAFVDGPYLPVSTLISFTPSATTGAGITITSSVPFFVVGHVGASIRLKHGAVWGWAIISVFNSNVSVTANVQSDFGAATASDAYAEGAWSAYRGYPSCVTLFQQRSWWADTTHLPDTFWGSQTGDYENMSPGTALDNEGVTFTLAANRVNAIRWLAPARALLAGTTGQEWEISGGSVDQPITPSSINAKAETSYGSSNVSPVQINESVIFLQRSGRKLREYSFVFTSDSYQAPDLSVLSEHITLGGLKQIDYQQELDSILWGVRADGTLVGMTYEKAQDVIAWHKHFTGTAQNLTDGKFESVAVVPHPNGNEDQLWVIVNRTIGGATKRYVEYLDTQGGFYGLLTVDAGLTYSGAPASTISGLSHLEGQTVDILGNGAVYPQQVVTGGQITGLSPTVTSAEVGLHFDSTGVTMRPEAGGDSGTAQGAHKRISQIIVRLDKTIGATINNDQMTFRKAHDPMDTAVPLFTGDKVVANLGWDRDGRITVQQKQPLPLTVVAIIATMEVGDS